MKHNKKVLKFVTAICSVLSIQVLATDIQKNSIEKNKKFNEWISSEQENKKNKLPDRVIVKYKDSELLSETASNTTTGKPYSAMASKLNKRSKAKLSHVRKLNSKKHIFNLDRTDTELSVTQVISQLEADPDVDSVEEDPKRQLMSQTQPWGIANVQADQLSDSTSGNMTVCIIDSGYEITNPDLVGNNVSGENDSGTGNWWENGGSHGTHVAGTIAGVNNTIGVEGILPNTNVNLFIVKVFNDDGWGYSSDLVDAIDTCVDNGAKVINMSLGGTGSSTTESASMQAAADSGVLLIAASGNSGDSTLSYPASYDSVMSVAAVDETGMHAEFSQYTAQVEVAGPGEAVLSTVAGDGRLGSITVNGTTYEGDRVNSQSRYAVVSGSYVISHINGSVTAALGQCTLSNSTYSCTDVSGNICLVERDGNQSSSSYPEIDAVTACTDAGATGVIVYSNSDRPGLQHPFLVDANGDADVPYVSVNRTLGLELIGNVGYQTTLTVVDGQDYDFYNGTSMATPHVVGVAALAWSNNINCTADEVRQALKDTAIDLETTGRDDETGYGLVQAKAASDYLADGCDGGGDTDDGTDSGTGATTEETNLSASRRNWVYYSVEVPAGMSTLDINISGGTGDADLYVNFGSTPTTTSYDCRPYLSGNTEACSFTTPSAGTWEIGIRAYSAFSGVTLTTSYQP